jgi:hypothetical protein
MRNEISMILRLALATMVLFLTCCAQSDQATPPQEDAPIEVAKQESQIEPPDIEGGRPQDESETEGSRVPVEPPTRIDPGIYSVDVEITNRVGDSFFSKVQASDPTITLDRIQEYADNRIPELFARAMLQTGYTINATLEFDIGIEGKMLKDPVKDPEGLLMEIGGTATLPEPTVKAKFLIFDGDDQILESEFDGGRYVSSDYWEGTTRAVDLAIGHILKDLAKEGIEVDGIIKLLLEGELLSTAPYVHLKANFGWVRLHQDGNLWEALSELGDVAVPILQEKAKDDDPEISDEARSLLEKLGAPLNGK